THAIDWIKDLTLCTKQKDFCPCGGTFAEGVGCKVPAGFALACPSGQDAPQVTSGVYPSACAPAKHDCVNGGVRVGAQCKVKAYGPNDLPTPGAGYYVDADPRWPGLYYPQVNGACPYGGVSMHGACQVDPYGPTLLETGVDYTVVRSGSTAGVYYSPDFPAP
ncbi:MAG: hypothetical protein JST92_09705, partial [Deltaproteobacteria bacterium]|nr:hypothetical protein [Deltaproteobacteria bacterium]